MNIYNAKQYFEAHGYIYGDGQVIENNRIVSHEIEKFNNFGHAIAWLNTSELTIQNKTLITRREAHKFDRFIDQRYSNREDDKK